MSDVFTHRDLSKIPLYWDEHYVQHNPQLPNGTAPLLAFLQQSPSNFAYEAGFSITQGDLVMLRGRYTGIAPTPMVVADIFRLDGGKIVEHWDIMQPETPASETKSGNPMSRRTKYATRRSTNRLRYCVDQRHRTVRIRFEDFADRIH